MSFGPTHLAQLGRLAKHQNRIVALVARGVAVILRSGLRAKHAQHCKLVKRDKDGATVLVKSKPRVKSGGSSRPGEEVEVYIPEVLDAKGPLPVGLVNSYFRTMEKMFEKKQVNAILPGLGPVGKSLLRATIMRREPMRSKALNNTLRVLFSALVNGEEAQSLGSSKMLRQAGPSISHTFGLQLIERLPLGGWLGGALTRAELRASSNSEMPLTYSTNSSKMDAQRSVKGLVW